MKRLLVFLFLIAMMGGHCFAQTTSVDSTKDQNFWEREIDSNAEWGKWLKSFIKPYWDNLSEATGNYRNFLSSIITEKDDMKNLLPEQIIEKMHEREMNYCKVLQSITPPSELAAYHDKILTLCFEATKDSTQKETFELLSNKLGKEAHQELERIFTKHNVPQKIIDKFTKKSE